VRAAEDRGVTALGTVPRAQTEAVRLAVRGVVQGVGFRPFAHRLADRLGLAGWVRNRPGMVEIALEGPRDAIDRFVDALTAAPPPLAVIEAVARRATRPTGATGFAITASVARDRARQPVSPDVALCAACAAELADPRNRRYRHPFITCTDCGPRFTAIEAMPYDRDRTSMRPFRPCTA
jgi:hydrogenase maturation protein HypF